MSDADYWYCLKHKGVEGTEGCRSSDRLGPYATREEAAAALDRVAERNAQWDNDPDWNDDGLGPGDASTDDTLGS